MVATQALTITDGDLTVAAESLAAQVPEEMLAMGCAYPSLGHIREVSLKIAADVAMNIVKEGRMGPAVAAELTSYESVLAKCKELMYWPSY